jgi:lysophospholipase L1-like esterase
MLRSSLHWLRSLFTRQGLPKLILLLLSAGFTLVTLELGYRVIIFGADSFSIEKMDSFHRLGYSYIVQPSDCPEMVYELAPNLDVLFKLAPFQTNAAGQRDTAYNLPKPPGVFRIAVLGDSLTMGSGVPLEETYHARLEHALNQGGGTYEVISFGAGGYSLRQYLGVLHCRAAAYDPDLILIGFYPENDAEIPPEEIFHQPYKRQETVRAFFTPFALRELASTARYKAQGWALTALGLAPDAPTPEQTAYMRGIFDQFGAYSRENGAPVLLLYLTYRTDHSLQPGEIEPPARAAGLCFLDLSAAFAGEDPAAYRLLPIDDHPNAAANAKFASRLQEYLAAASLLTGGTCP